MGPRVRAFFYKLHTTFTLQKRDVMQLKGRVEKLARSYLNV